jgi:hypothetical protein
MTAGGENFTASGTVVLKPGFTAIMPWRVGQGLGREGRLSRGPAGL